MVVDVDVGMMHYTVIIISTTALGCDSDLESISVIFFF